jgi:hypothetical protein
MAMLAFDGNLAGVQDLVLGGLDPFVKDADGRTLLHWVSPYFALVVTGLLSFLSSSRFFRYRQRQVGMPRLWNGYCTNLSVK